MNRLNILYEEHWGDRWLPFDRYPRALIRRIVRGKPPIGGQHLFYLNLCAGLKELGVPLRKNGIRHALRNPSEVIALVGKHPLLDKYDWKNPIVYGPSAIDHPVVDPNLFDRKPVRRIVLPCSWMAKMFEEHFGPERVATCPVGIDTERWTPGPEAGKDIDFLVYEKSRWFADRYQKEIFDPLYRILESKGARVATLHYGRYKEEEFQALLKRSRAMVFVCSSETQGLAYMQALSSGVPIFAFDEGGVWTDPYYYPHKVVFGPVTSVPYFNKKCGVRLERASELETRFNEFEERLARGEFAPRQFILDGYTLKKRAQAYLDIVREVEAEVASR